MEFDIPSLPLELTLFIEQQKRCVSRNWLPYFYLLAFVVAAFAPAQQEAEAGELTSYLAAGFGAEQLTYHEQIPEIGLASSDTETTNWTLNIEGRKFLKNFFLGAQAGIPLSSGEEQETWTREGEFEQTNSLSYRRIRIGGHAGYFLHPLLQPYVGLGWHYSEQKRSNFDNVDTPGIIEETATEEVRSFSALFGIQGEIPFSEKWSFFYFAEYMLPFYSNITNDGLPGWEASNIEGYTYSLTGRLSYNFTETVSAGLQITGGRQHWEGSDWIPFGDSKVMWPENDTDFLSFFINVYRYF